MLKKIFNRVFGKIINKFKLGLVCAIQDAVTPLFNVMSDDMEIFLSGASDKDIDTAQGINEKIIGSVSVAIFYATKAIQSEGVIAIIDLNNDQLRVSSTQTIVFGADESHVGRWLFADIENTLISFESHEVTCIRLASSESDLHIYNKNEGVVIK